MKNIVFDLGGVVFARNPHKCTPEFADFFAFIRAPQMPRFWEEYDRGALSLGEVKAELCRINNCPPALCDAYVAQAIALQEPIAATAQLVADLRAAGYRLYVLSNMSREFIDFLRCQPVYRLFDGEVVSCEEFTVKPEPRIYEILLDRYDLDPAETLFIDDRPANLEAAARFGIATHWFDPAAPEAVCEALRAQLL